jgi:hypothetical protein
MPTVLRIRNPAGAQPRGAADPLKEYLDRLVKLIPTEVVGLYLAGKALIEAAGNAPKDGYWIGWTLFCLAAVIAVRAWATSDKDAGVRPEWPAVIIAAFSYLVWIYSFGDAFRALGWWDPLFGGLLVLAWTFVVPFLYRGEGGAGGNVGTDNRWSTTIPPAEFRESDAEHVVVQAAHDLTGARVSLSDKISDRFTSTRQMRKMVGHTQDLIFRDFDIWVELATASEGKLEELRGGAYDSLARWVHFEVKSTGRPSVAKWELDQ